LVLRVVGIGWGLPASDGWDNDGVAPRDFLAGLVQTFTPGAYYTYPPVHLVLLGIVTAPVTIVALVKAPSLGPADVVQTILHVPYMTAIAYVARAVSLLMSLGVVWAIAKIAEELRGRRAGWWAAAFAGVNVPLTYYAHTTNLDVPYLFWSSLALLALVRAMARHEPRRLRAMAVLAVLAIGTKDQAYAIFLVGAPVALAAWFALDAWARRNVRAIAKETALAVGIAVVLLAIADAVVFNPSGFRARVVFLLGPASQNYAHYSNDWVGRLDVVEDFFTRFGIYYPRVFALFVVGGLVAHFAWQRRDRPRLAAGLVPMLAAISFTAAFNCIARRTDHRFLMPQAVLEAVYGGMAVEAVVYGFKRASIAWTARAAVAVSFAVAIFEALDVDANLLLDPRYEAERWMAANVPRGETIETYGLNVYMPRFPPQARVARVGPDASDHRNPLPGVEEVVDAYGNAGARRPRFIVVSSGWVWRYLLDPAVYAKEGRVLPPTQIENGSDHAATAYFKRLCAGMVGYRLAHKATWRDGLWPPLDIHAATSREIWIYERID
jgi:4-amino-4-deoxy-L-arabinose transferase-like glycosyltransferase